MVLLNGAPGSGKTTVAAVLARGVPGVLHLDVDEVRSHVPGWREDPGAAGLRARALVTATVLERAAAGRSTVISQLAAERTFPDGLAWAAESTRARFVHVVLDVAPALGSARASVRAADAVEGDPDALDARTVRAYRERLDLAFPTVPRIDASADLPAVVAAVAAAAGLRLTR